MTTATPAKPPRPAHDAAHRHPIENPFITLFGLLVVWSSLVIIFTANRLSETYHQFNMSGVIGQGRDNALLMSLEPQVKILLPFSLFVPRQAPAEALKVIGSYANFHVLDEGLDKLDPKARSYRFANVPVYQVLHHVIDKPTLGMLIVNNNLSLIEQDLTTRRLPNNSRELNWEANVPLQNQQVLVVPTDEIPVWLKLRLTGEPNVDISKWNAIDVEVHRGTDLLTLTRAVLDEKGRATLAVNDTQTVNFSIERRQPGTFHFKLHYQAYE